MINRMTVLDNEDTQPLDINRKNEADMPEGEQGNAQGAGGQEKADLMQDEEDTDGSV